MKPTISIFLRNFNQLKKKVCIKEYIWQPRMTLSYLQPSMFRKIYFQPRNFQEYIIKLK